MKITQITYCGLDVPIYGPNSNKDNGPFEKALLICGANCDTVGLNKSNVTWLIDFALNFYNNDFGRAGNAIKSLITKITSIPFSAETNQNKEYDIFKFFDYEIIKVLKFINRTGNLEKIKSIQNSKFIDKLIDNIDKTYLLETWD